MIGAIIGDVVGSRFEWHNHKSKDFDLFKRKCHVTDDSVMSLAIALSIMQCEGDYSDLSAKAIENMQGLGKIYIKAGYGGNFIKWIMSKNPKPYNSYGNGSAMRVSACGYAAKSIKEAKELSAKVTEVTHNHPEGMKGAEAVAVAIFLARKGKSMDKIRKHITENYYKIDFTLDEIRDGYEFDVSCQGSVPVAFEAFFESTSFEDAIRNAISVGGDSDTIGAITGSIAEAYYGVPEEIIGSVIKNLDSLQMKILYYFEGNYPSKAIVEDHDKVDVFTILDMYVDKIIPEGAPIEVSEDLGNGVVRANVNPQYMVPDFSSFDKKKKW
ncbi:ADP-ribosylglycohydrolase [Lachnospiraceae bacterium]|nr:ADP-ribosylglycohydrolase [Lachnospiraceae bacterium]